MAGLTPVDIVRQAHDPEQVALAISEWLIAPSNYPGNYLRVKKARRWMAGYLVFVSTAPALRDSPQLETLCRAILDPTWQPTVIRLMKRSKFGLVVELAENLSEMSGDDQRVFEMVKRTPFLLEWETNNVGKRKDKAS